MINLSGYGSGVSLTDTLSNLRAARIGHFHAASHDFSSHRARDVA